MDEIQTNTDIKIAQRTTLFISMFASFVFPFTANSLNIAIPFIGEEFQVPATSLTWVMSAMMLANISINVPIGRFADLWNKRKVFSLGILIFSVAAMLGAFAPNYWTLIVFRVFQGIGGAMFISTNFAILMDVFPANQRGRVLGLSVMCTYLGLSVGPLVGGFFIRYFSWNAIFITTSLLALIVFGVAIISMSKLPKKTAIQPKSISISPASNILYILAMLVFMYGFTVFGQHIYSYFFLATGVILLVIFAHHELKTKYPVIDMRLFRGNLNFIFSNLSALLNYAAVGALSYLLTIFLVVVKGFQPDIAGLILIIQPALMAVVSPIIGRLSDKHSPFIISSIGMAICALSMLLFLFLSEDSSLVFVVVILLIIGLGVGIFSTPNTNAILSSVSPKESAVANSILSTMRLVGQLSSMAIITIIMHFTIGNALISEAGTKGIMSTLHTSFIIFGLLCVSGVLLSLRRKQKPVK